MTPEEEDELIDLWRFIKHGDNKHQEWLWEALVAFKEGRERPEEA